MGLEERPFYGRAYRFARQLVRWYLGPCRIEGQENIRKPAIYICRHQNMHGPVHVMAFTPVPLHIWSMYMFFDKKTAQEHFYRYTLTQRFGYGKLRARFLSWLYGVHAAACMKQMGAIPVYRGHREVLKTFELSQNTLLAGGSIVIFPDVNYSDTDDHTGTLYAGYLHLCRSYYKKTGQVLPVIPICCPMKNRELIFGEPLCMDMTRPFADEKERLTEEIAAVLDTLAQKWDSEE